MAHSIFGLARKGAWAALGVAGIALVWWVLAYLRPLRVATGPAPTAQTIVAAAPGGTPLPYPAPVETQPASIPYPQPLQTLPAASTALKTYTDPHGTFTLEYPADWELNVDDMLTGPGSYLKIDFLSTLANLDRVGQVCEWLANIPNGPGRKLTLVEVEGQEACLMEPFIWMSTDMTSLVIQNRTSQPELRYFRVTTPASILPEIAATLRFVQTGETPPPTSPVLEITPAAEPVRPLDELSDGLVLEEYPVVAAGVDSPTHFEFNDRIPPEVFARRQAWRIQSLADRFARANALLEPFGYRFQSVGAEDVFTLYKGEELLLAEITNLWPGSLQVTADVFALVVEVEHRLHFLVRNTSLQPWDASLALMTPPVWTGSAQISLRYDPENHLLQIQNDDQTVYSFAVTEPTVANPVKGLYTWDGHWLLAVDGFLVRDGQVLNPQLEVDEIFGWQLLNGKPFYYFVRDGQTGMAYGGQELPVRYDEVIHDRCCEPAAFNNGGNESMIWFYALRDGVWHYVELGIYP